MDEREEGDDKKGGRRRKKLRPYYRLAQKPGKGGGTGEEVSRNRENGHQHTTTSAGKSCTGEKM